MQQKLLILLRLAIVLFCVANTQHHFLTGHADTALSFVTLLVIFYEVFESHKKIREYRKEKQSQNS
ncbi:hypothetical protein ACVR1I_02515 [Streptococcus cameli]